MTTRLLGISDFNLQSLSAELARLPGLPAVEAVDTPYGQVAQTILDPGAPGWHPAPDVALVWTRPEGVLETFARVLRGETVPIEQALADVDAFADLVGRLEGRVRTVLVCPWVLPPDRKLFATWSWNDPAGPDRLLARLNARLLERLDARPGFFTLPAPNWLASLGSAAWSPKLWTLGKIPWTNALFQEAALSIQSTLAGIAGRSRKLLLLDLDNTLWGGILGDDGIDGIRLGPPDPVGEAFADFQRAVLALSRRGVALGLVSKNEEATALHAIREHPEMALELRHFAGWRINWNDKAANVADLTHEINVGLDAVVFVDDNPVERARVADALPDVLVPDWPADPANYVRALQALRCFDAPTLSDEDRERSVMYAAERERRVARTEVRDLGEWLETLATVATCEPLGERNLGRAAQLLNKTNQMNLTTRRLAEAELLAWSRTSGNVFWCFRVADKLGDLGLTGLLSLERHGSGARIVDFVLSCRVLGRRVEETMLAHAIAWARDAGFDEVSAQPIATPKNAPCLRFFRDSVWERDEAETEYRWPTARPFDVPNSVQLVVRSD